MKVTAIRQQARRNNRYSIYVDDAYAFSLSDAALLESGLAGGQELTDAELAAYKQASADDKAYTNALAYAMLRPRSHWEMEQYLKRKRCSPALATKILNKLRDNGTLDDETFAQAWITNRRLLKTTSRRRLLQELRAKRVPDEIAERAVAEDDTDEGDVLAELIARKRKQTRYQDDQTLMRYLAGQGFKYGDIKDALEREQA